MILSLLVHMKKYLLAVARMVPWLTQKIWTAREKCKFNKHQCQVKVNATNPYLKYTNIGIILQ
jgi:hypothetical protein